MAWIYVSTKVDTHQEQAVAFQQIAETCRRRGGSGCGGVSRMDAATELTWTYLQRPPQPDPPRHPTDSPLLLLQLLLPPQVQGAALQSPPSPYPAEWVYSRPMPAACRNEPWEGTMRNTFKTLLLALPLCLAALSAQAADGAAGRWKTIDDKTGKVKSIVEISQAANGTLTGKVVDILHSDKGPNPVCDGCEGVNKNKPVKGMTILWNLKADGANKWSGGTILDPANGKTYKSKMELQPGGTKLDVSGCIAFICRAQTWQRE